MTDRVIGGFMLSLMLTAGCSNRGPSTELCEHARDRFLANHTERFKALREEVESERIAGRIDEGSKAREREAFAAEMRTARTKFVAVCTATPGFKLDCFDSVATEDSAECKTFTNDVSH